MFQSEFFLLFFIFALQLGVKRDRWANEYGSELGKKHELNIPPYEGIDQVVELPRNH